MLGLIITSLPAFTNSWAPAPPMRSARESLGAAVLGGKVYAVGGSPDGGYSLLPSVEVFDPATQRWSAAANLTTGRSAHGVGVIGEQIYAVAGIAGYLGVGNTMDIYDASTDSWRAGPKLQHARSHVAVGVSGGCHARSRLHAYFSLRDLQPSCDRVVAEI